MRITTSSPSIHYNTRKHYIETTYTYEIYDLEEIEYDWRFSLNVNDGSTPCIGTKPEIPGFDNVNKDVINSIGEWREGGSSTYLRIDIILPGVFPLNKSITHTLREYNSGEELITNFTHTYYAFDNFSDIIFTSFGCTDDYEIINITLPNIFLDPINHIYFSTFNIKANSIIGYDGPITIESRNIELRWIAVDWETEITSKQEEYIDIGTLLATPTQMDTGNTNIQIVIKWLGPGYNSIMLKSDFIQNVKSNDNSRYIYFWHDYTYNQFIQIRKTGVKPYYFPAYYLVNGIKKKVHLTENIKVIK